MAESVVIADDWDVLVDALAREGVRYLTGGANWEDLGDSPLPSPSVEHWDPESLLRGLAASRHARLRDAIIALLLLHPEYSGNAQMLLANGDLAASSHVVLQSRLIAAACLQRLWWFTLRIYLPDQPLISADVVTGAGLPSPDLEYGRPCLTALAERLEAAGTFPYNYHAEFARVVDLLLADLIAEANHAA
ncbi:MAG TPA: hypothetical protein VNL71_16660 [Chloroflexota bacterium]|nr:hypothetical protein [Chloroflexota bacterium]